jgi:hypothetical protein
MADYEIVEDSFYDPYRAPLAVPGETADRKYVQVQPTTAFAGQRFDTLSQISFLYQNPSTLVDLYNSYVQMTVRYVKADGTAFAAADVACIERDPVFFRSAILQLGGASVENQSSYMTTVNWLRKKVKSSWAALQAQGNADLSYPDVVIPAGNDTAFPGTPGCQSVVLTPLTGNADATLATANPAYNEGLRKRLQRTGASRPASFRVPLGDIYSFIHESTPVFWGGAINISLLPASNIDTCFQATGGGAQDNSYLTILQCSLYVCTRTPRASVMARLLKEASLGTKTKYQWLHADCPQVVQIPANANGVNVAVTLPNASPQFLALVYKPTDWGVNTRFPNQVALPPLSINSECPYSNAYVVFNGQQCPQFAYGAGGSADNVRLYEAFKTLCDQTSQDGSGCSVDFETWTQNAFITVFDLRGRSADAPPSGIPSNQCTVVANFRAGIQAAAQCFVIAFGVAEAQFSFSTQGVAITSQ